MAREKVERATVVRGRADEHGEGEQRRRTGRGRGWWCSGRVSSASGRLRPEGVRGGG